MIWRRAKYTEEPREKRMFYNLDEEPLDGPNPPPWKVDYVNDQEGNAVWYSDILPEAHTHGIDRFNGLDLQLRKAPPNKAAFVLDTIGLFLLVSKIRARIGDQFRVADTNYTVVPALGSSQRPVLRLAWSKDPRLPDDDDYDRVLEQFRAACAARQIPLD